MNGPLSAPEYYVTVYLPAEFGQSDVQSVGLRLLKAIGKYRFSSAERLCIRVELPAGSRVDIQIDFEHVEAKLTGGYSYEILDRQKCWDYSYRDTLHCDGY